MLAVQIIQILTQNLAGSPLLLRNSTQAEPLLLAILLRGQQTFLSALSVLRTTIVCYLLQAHLSNNNNPTWTHHSLPCHPSRRLAPVPRPARSRTSLRRRRSRRQPRSSPNRSHLAAKRTTSLTKPPFPFLAAWKKRFDSMRSSADASKKKTTVGTPPRTSQRLHRNEFTLGTAGLAPKDHYYLDYTLNHVLHLPAWDQLTWRQGIQAARASYAEVMDSDLARMRQEMDHWLHSDNNR